MAQSSPAGFSRIPALLGAIGGVLVAGAYFLPWNLGLDPGSSDTKPVLRSAWDTIYQLATGGSHYNSQYHLTENTPGYPFEAFLIGAPLVMGVIMLALGIWGLFQRPGALRLGLFGAALFLAVISTQGTASLTLLLGVSIATTATTEQVSNQALVGLGPSVLYVRLFVAATAGISALLTRERQPAPLSPATE
jgi:hypothetical protein